MKRELWYSVVVRDRHGKIVSRERRKSKSFVEQWNQAIYIHCSQTAFTMTDISGVGQSKGPQYLDLYMAGSAGDDDDGIVVGTGNTAVAIDDYALDSLITEGAGAGQLNYLDCTVDLPVVAAPNCGYLVSRSAVNNSGALITARESGIQAAMGPPNADYFLVVRDVFAAAQDIPNGGSITVDYTLRVTA